MKDWEKHYGITTVSLLTAPHKEKYSGWRKEGKWQFPRT